MHTNLTDTLCPPSGAHLLGCDNLGYDQLGRLMVGGQTSLEVGFAAAIVAVLIGTLYGAFSGFVGGPVDSFLMRIVDAGLSIPSIMVIVILSVVFHPSPLMMIFIIAVFYWLGVARLVRGETLSAAHQGVRAGGQGGRRPAAPRGRAAHRAERDRHDHRAGHVRGRRLDPDPVRPGLPRPRRRSRPATDWGNMLSGGLTYIQSGTNYWWLIYPAGFAIILTCIAFNFIGDALRDAFETRLQRR